MGGLTGKNVLITGATSGIGLEAAVTLATQGARLALVGRDPARTTQALEEVKHRSGSSQIESFLCDFSSQTQIRKLSANVHSRFDRLNVLINNAGGVFKCRTVTEDGIEATFAVNHLGYFLLTHLLLDLLEKGAPARIVNVASVGHKRGTLSFDDLGYLHGYGIMKAYNRSKLANVLFTRELARRLSGKGITVNALHPGAVATRIWNGAPLWTQPLLSIFKRTSMISPAAGGDTLTYLATSPAVEGKSGLYFEQNRPSLPAPLAQDDALALRLWDESERLVGTARQIGFPPETTAAPSSRAGHLERP
jgi:NAD(P)-dependent dehydrogenase (short-subunit alcohol dehydrogenase family)